METSELHMNRVLCNFPMILLQREQIEREANLRGVFDFARVTQRITLVWHSLC